MDEGSGLEVESVTLPLNRFDSRWFFPPLQFLQKDVVKAASLELLTDGSSVSWLCEIFGYLPVDVKP